MTRGISEERLRELLKQSEKNNHLRQLQVYFNMSAEDIAKKL